MVKALSQGEAYDSCTYVPSEVDHGGEGGDVTIVDLFGAQHEDVGVSGARDEQEVTAASQLLEREARSCHDARRFEVVVGGNEQVTALLLVRL